MRVLFYKVLISFGAFFAIIFFITSCSSCANVERKSFTPRSHDDLPEGPGLFSGEDGEFVIYSQKEKVSDKKQ